MRYAIGTLLILLPLGALWAEWGILSIELGKENKSNGIIEKPQADGFTEPAEVEDRECRYVPEVPPNLPNVGNHIYFSVDRSVVPDKEKTHELWIAVEFFDSAKKAQGLILDYDNKGDIYPQQAFALDLPLEKKLIPFENTGEWRIAIKHIEDAEFKDQGNNADFRFHIHPYKTEGFYIARVWVSDREIKEEDLIGRQPVPCLYESLPEVWGRVKSGR